MQSGKLKHFVPQDGLYCYFRYNDKDCVMVCINNNENDAKTIDTKRYSEFLDHYTSGSDVITGQTFTDFSKIEIKPKSAMIIELKINK